MSDRLSLLLLAAERGDIQDIRRLIEQDGVDPCTGSEDSFRPNVLHLSCLKNPLRVVKYLIETVNCDPVCVDEAGCTPLHYACHGGHMPVVKYLIETVHCDPMCVDSSGWTPLHAACSGGYVLVAEYLIVTAHCDPMCVDRSGCTPLHAACSGGHVWAAAHLIEAAQCDPMCVTKYGMTPFHYACAHGHIRVVKYLIESARCDPFCILASTNTYGYIHTPLHCACNRGHMNVVKYLIETVHCDPMCLDVYGWTPLYCACDSGHIGVVKHLIETVHCDPVCVDKNKLTLLHRACYRGHAEVVKYLIETAHCDPMCVDGYGRTPLCCTSHIVVVKYLIETTHCDPMWVGKYGLTLLHHACDNGYMEVVKYLIKTANCNPMHVDGHGWTPLHHACDHGRMDVVKYLLVECCVNPNCKDINGKTPLDLALKKPTIAKELVKAGANSTIQPTETPVKVFIVGNPSAGKSSLTKALQKETSALGAALAFITGPRLVSDVEQNTAGIVPCQFTSTKFGSVTFYDFAGQQEYYASHAALLQNSITSSIPLFIIVVNLCDSEEDIEQKLVYWISFLANQCTSVTTKPHVIIVGSHSDVVWSRGEDPRAKVNMEFLQTAHVSNSFHISKFIPMDCRQFNSYDIINLAESMKESCASLRTQAYITYHLYHLFTFLIEKFQGNSAVSFQQVLSLPSKEIPIAMENPEYLHSSCKRLHDSGHIVYHGSLVLLPGATQVGLLLLLVLICYFIQAWYLELLSKIILRVASSFQS